ncbi:MAG: hypothetical protein WCW52_10930 [Elusimicrobiales bacterium]|jgi:hypothetical protein
MDWRLVQRNVLQEYTNGESEQAVECQASEISGVIMLIAGDYRIDNRYTADYCPVAVQVFKNIHDDLKRNSQMLAPGQVLSVSGNFSAHYLPGGLSKTYISLFDAKNSTAVKDLKQARRWKITGVELSPLLIDGTNEITILTLKDPVSSLEIKILLKSRGLHIYTDDLERAFNGKIKATPE